MILFMKVNFVDSNCNIVNSGQFNMDYDLNMLDFAIENAPAENMGGEEEFIAMIADKLRLAHRVSVTKKS